MKASEMTPEQIRVRCGEIDLLKKGIQIWSRALPGNPTLRFDVPDYTNSIDAINASVLRLPEEKQKAWVLELTGFKMPVWPSHLALELFCATATPLERARAFVAIHEGF